MNYKIKLCKDCTYCIKEPEEYSELKCKHPLYRMDLVTGEVEYRYMESCDYNRATGGCSWKGDWFVSKKKKKEIPNELQIRILMALEDACADNPKQVLEEILQILKNNKNETFKRIKRYFRKGN